LTAVAVHRSVLIKRCSLEVTRGKGFAVFHPTQILSVGGAGWGGVGWTTLCLSTNATNGEGHAVSETPPGVMAPNEAKRKDRLFAKTNYAAWLDRCTAQINVQLEPGA